MNYYLSGKTRPRQNTLDRIVKEYGVPLEWLRGDDVEVPDETEAPADKRKKTTAQKEARRQQLEAFQDRLKILWDLYDLTPTKFAESIGRSRLSVDYYIRGLRMPSEKALERIAEVYHVSPAWLLGENDTCG